MQTLEDLHIRLKIVRRNLLAVEEADEELYPWTSLEIAEVHGLLAAASAKLAKAQMLAARERNGGV